jgi:PPOX class probable F420-dependent enzyme
MSVGSLAGEKYISLTTFKRDGTPVATPVWGVSDDGRRLLVWTGASTWKVKRIRRDPHVRVAASDFKGKTRGETYDGVARLLDDSAGSVVDALLDRKYWLSRRLLAPLNKVIGMITREQPEERAYIEIVDSQQQV